MGIRINGSTSGYTEIDAPAEGGNSTAGIILPSGSTADRPASGQAGQVRFNTTTGQMEYWSSTSDTPQWRNIKDGPLNQVSVRYLVIGGGGGGGGYTQAGGGGAGGYRTNFGTGNISGGNSAVEADLTLLPETQYTVTVGAGGAGGINNSSTGYGQRGSDSVFASITSYGGGGGGIYSGIMPPTSQLPVGSGGGAPNDSTGTRSGQAGTAGQGSDGGSKLITAHTADYPGMGGGGAGAPGESRTTSTDQERDGGDGLASTITGTSVTRAGGGGGGLYRTSLPLGAGGAGGGGDGAYGSIVAGSSGVANTGGGGGGAGYSLGTGGDGGSGVVILRIPNTWSATFSGVTASAAASVSSDRVYTVTAGTGTVTFTKD